MTGTPITIALCPSCGAKAGAWLDGLEYKQVCDHCGYEVWGGVTEVLAEAFRLASQPPPSNEGDILGDVD